MRDGTCHIDIGEAKQTSVTYQLLKSFAPLLYAFSSSRCESLGQLEATLASNAAHPDPII